MLWSSACEYAIRATTYLAERPDTLVQLRDIAVAERLPAPFVSKILQGLVRAGLLRSVKGPGGGYGLARPASAITFLDVRAAIDGTHDLHACPAGLGTCSSSVPCPLHESYEPVRRAINDYLAHTTIEQASTALARTRRRLAARGRRPSGPASGISAAHGGKAAACSTPSGTRGTPDRQGRGPARTGTPASPGTAAVPRSRRERT